MAKATTKATGETAAKKTAAKAAPKAAAKAPAKPVHKPTTPTLTTSTVRAAPPSVTLNPGDAAPGFDLEATNAAATGGRVSLTALKGKPFLLYFYPKADTPGCTTEACAFNEALPQFKGKKLVVVGVSKDPMRALEKFALKYSLDFPLASDPQAECAMAYGIWGEKKFMGRSYMGMERSTFLVDAKGRIAKVWRNVKVDGHAAEVLEAVQAL
jgi:peroxiredoxin Q/BCP